MYEKRLETLVLRLKKTGAKLIWATTTPVCPAAERTMEKRFKTTVVISEETEKKYLDAALKVMQKYKIPINDLHAAIRPQLKKYARADNDVHFNKEGRKLLGDKVAESIKKTLLQTVKPIEELK